MKLVCDKPLSLALVEFTGCASAAKAAAGGGIRDKQNLVGASEEGSGLIAILQLCEGVEMVE